jgi:hypothetical protein
MTLAAGALLKRRDVLRMLAAAAGSAALRPAWGRPQAGSLPPVRAITGGPKSHWFANYDKLQFDPGGRYALGMEADFEGRPPAPDDVVGVGMVDLREGDRWIELGTSRAWNWQQGCMLQWLPGSRAEVIWNDRQGDRFVCHVLDVGTRSRRTLPAPVYALSPVGSWAIATDFRRLFHTRPGYGYAGVPDPNHDVRAPDDSGIWRIDLRTGRTDLLLSLARIAAIRPPRDEPAGMRHWFNFLLVSPDGSRFSFLHRRRRVRGAGFTTRLFTADPDGDNLYLLDERGGTSHYIWRDPRHILAWSNHPSRGEKFYLYEDRTDAVEVVGPDAMTEDGHCSYLPGGRWILNDTQPDERRLAHAYLYDVARGTRHPLGDFRAPPEYVGEWRCDLHPRSSPDGRSVVVDAPLDGQGRQMHLIDVSGLVGS